MFSRYLITSVCLFGLSVAHAADPLVCENTLDVRLSDDAPRAVPLDDPNAIQLEAGRMEAQLGEHPTASLSGGIVLRRGDKLAGAGETRDGGSFYERMGAVACWNAVMDENQYMVRKWNEFIAA